MSSAAPAAALVSVPHPVASSASMDRPMHQVTMCALMIAAHRSTVNLTGAPADRVPTRTPAAVLVSRLRATSTSVREEDVGRTRVVVSSQSSWSLGRASTTTRRTLTPPLTGLTISMTRAFSPRKFSDGRADDDGHGQGEGAGLPEKLKEFTDHAATSSRRAAWR